MHQLLAILLIVDFLRTLICVSPPAEDTEWIFHKPNQRVQTPALVLAWALPDISALLFSSC
jgi:hypothetical protein